MNIPYPLRTSALLPSLGCRMLRMLKVPPSIQRIPHVCPHAKSSEHIAWFTLFFIIRSLHISAFLNLNGGWRVGACNLSPRVNTCLLSPYSPQVFIRPLPFHSHWAFTCLMLLRIPRVNTHPLWCVHAAHSLPHSFLCWQMQSLAGNAQICSEFHHSHVRISAHRASLIESFVAIAVADFGNTGSVTAASNLPPFSPLQFASCLHSTPL